MTEPGGIMTEPGGIMTEPGGIMTEPGGIMTEPNGSGVRRQLAVLVGVVTSLVLLAFLIPLGIVLRNDAANRAIDAANAEAQSDAAYIAASPETVASVAVPTDGLIVSVFMPDGIVKGAQVPRTTSVALARSGRAFTAQSGDGVEALAPVQTQGGTIVVRVYAPPALLHAGVDRTWTILFALGLALLGMGLLLADRLGRRLVGAVTGLAKTADRLSTGDLTARAALTGPRELRGVGAELNRLAARISELLTAEREEVADLAHRLRTPVTALRLDAEEIADPADRERLSGDVDQLVRVVDEVIRTARRPVREGAGARVDLAGLVRERVAFWTPLAEDDGRRIDASVPTAAVMIKCAAGDLAAAVDALIQNVFAHTPDRIGMRVSVTVLLGGGGELIVADDGPGMSIEDIARGAAGGGSTGLGLDIARRTAEAAGGAMAIRPGPAGGAEVALTFASAERKNLTV